MMWHESQKKFYKREDVQRTNAVAVDPTLVIAFPINLQVDVEGPTRGRTIGDANRLNDPRKTSRAALGVDVDRFLEEFMSRITSRLRAH